MNSAGAPLRPHAFSEIFMTQSTPLQRLLNIMKTLRDPQIGCSWDRKQTFATIAPYTLEETYEVLDAIERQDYADLRDELGDLLFQVVFYAQMGQEQGLFDFDEVCTAISDKLERRHPHIFGDAEGGDSEAVAARWEQLKAGERAEKALHSVLDDIPQALPALMKAHKIQKRCASVGFDWNTLGPVLDKVYEEIDEVMHEARQAVVDEQAGRGDRRSAVRHGEPVAPFRPQGGERAAGGEPQVRAPFPPGGSDRQAKRAAA